MLLEQAVFSKLETFVLKSITIRMFRISGAVKRRLFLRSKDEENCFNKNCLYPNYRIQKLLITFTVLCGIG